MNVHDFGTTTYRKNQIQYRYKRRALVQPDYKSGRTLNYFRVKLIF